MWKVTMLTPVPSTASVTSVMPKAKRPSSTATTRTNTLRVREVGSGCAEALTIHGVGKIEYINYVFYRAFPPKKLGVGRKVAAEKKTLFFSASKNNVPPLLLTTGTVKG